MVDLSIVSDRMTTAESVKNLIPCLLSWYGSNARKLPWREHPFPYNVWVSEIMLQQTRVETVLPYYRRFMERLPDVRSLWDCPEEELLKLWEGLGYYSRVRNMQKAAGIIMEKYGGKLPETVKELLSLPGIGSYTAGAIASIACGREEPAVDGNVLRVMSRVNGSLAVIDEPRVKKAWEEILRDALHLYGEAYGEAAGTERASESEKFNYSGAFNQALMDLGAGICLPNGAPLCERCPLMDRCAARREKLILKIPVRAKKKSRRVEERTIFAILKKDALLLRKREEKGLLAGLWELPNREGRLSEKEALEEIQHLGFSVRKISPMPEAKHIFTHVEWHMRGYLLRVTDGREKIKNIEDIKVIKDLKDIKDIEDSKDIKDKDIEDTEIEKGRSEAEREAGDFIEKAMREGGYVFASPANMKNYALPSAFSTYLKYLQTLPEDGD